MSPFASAILLAAIGRAPLVPGPSQEASPDQAVDEAAESEHTDLDARRLRAVFQDLVGRPPFAAERSAWRSRSVEELLDHLLESEEFWREWWEAQLYFFLLVDNFRPRSEGVTALPRELHEGRTDVRRALHRIALGQSFERRNPGPDTFVTVVLEQFLGLTVQTQRRELEIGKHLYDGHKGKLLGRSGSSQADVVRIAVEDPRALRFFLEREYRRLMRAELPPQESTVALRRLESDPLAYRQIVRSWFLSQAYDERLSERHTTPNRLFVRSLFVDLVDRLPAEGEAQQMRAALDGLADPTPLRSVLARLLIDSERVQLPKRESVSNAEAWIEDLFERVRGRRPTERELAQFVETFADPACRTRTVYYALFSDPEYATW